MSTRLEEARRFLQAVVARAGSQGLSSVLTSDPARAREIVEVVAPIAAVQACSIDWVGVNGRRVDVIATAPEREWRVVLSVDSEGVHAASAWERPRLFAGIPGGRAVIVNGPSSAGKSTVMDAVLAASETPWVKFDELIFGETDVRFLIWRDRAPTLRPGFVAGIGALAAAGNQVIVAGGGFPSTTFDVLRRQVSTLDVGLDCPLDVRVERQALRSDRWGGLTEGNDDQHSGWSYDLRFDTSSASPEEIATAILQRIAGAA